MFKQIGEYRLYTHCRFCGNSLEEPQINLGVIPLAGGFIKDAKHFSSEKAYPLTIAFCNNCFLLQVREVVNADNLFKDYFYHSSAIKTLVDHFRKIVTEFSTLSPNPKKQFIVEIGCNDGTFIDECIKQGFNVIGVDPADNIVKPLIKKGMPMINAYFTENVAKDITAKHGKANFIFSSNTLAHIENMHDVFNGIEHLLKKDGMLVFENHYLGKLIKEMQYDMIYHEHQYYYSVSTLVKFLKQHNLEIFDLQFINIHAGSIRLYVQKIGGGRKIKKVVSETLKQEKENGLTNEKTFIKYNKRITKTKNDLLKLLKTLKKDGKTIEGYGASGRGTLISNYCGLDETFLDYVIDDAPAKQGAYTPGTHLEIRSSDILKTKKRPDYILLFAWSFFNEIANKNTEYLKLGGKFIVPLPKVKIIAK